MSESIIVAALMDRRACLSFPNTASMPGTSPPLPLAELGGVDQFAFERSDMIGSNGKLKQGMKCWTFTNA